MKRLTDRKVAADLKKNIEGLRAVGAEPSMSDLRYVKLAEYEDAEERNEEDIDIPMPCDSFLMRRFLETN